MKWNQIKSMSITSGLEHNIGDHLKTGEISPDFSCTQSSGLSEIEISGAMLAPSPISSSSRDDKV